MDRGKYGSKNHLITERTGLPLSVGISGANLHVSQALIPLVTGIPPIRFRRARQRTGRTSSTPTRATTTPTCGDGCAGAASPPHRPQGHRDFTTTGPPPLDDRTHQAWARSPTADVSTDATSAKPNTSSPAPSSATAGSTVQCAANSMARIERCPHAGHRGRTETPDPRPLHRFHDHRLSSVRAGDRPSRRPGRPRRPPAHLAHPLVRRPAARPRPSPHAGTSSWLIDARRTPGRGPPTPQASRSGCAGLPCSPPAAMTPARIAGGVPLPP